MNELQTKHTWLETRDIAYLVKWAHEKFKGEARYGGDKVKTHMKIEFGRWVRMEKAALRDEIAMAQEHVFLVGEGIGFPPKDKQ